MDRRNVIFRVEVFHSPEDAEFPYSAQLVNEHGHFMSVWCQASNAVDAAEGILESLKDDPAVFKDYIDPPRPPGADEVVQAS